MNTTLTRWHSITGDWRMVQPSSFFKELNNVLLYPSKPWPFQVLLFIVEGLRYRDLLANPPSFMLSFSQHSYFYESYLSNLYNKELNMIYCIIQICSFIYLRKVVKSLDKIVFMLFIFFMKKWSIIALKNKTNFFKYIFEKR